MSLGRDQFFYVGQDNYDDLAARSLPHYHEAHSLISTILAERGVNVSAALDLGTGTGHTALAVLEVFPHAQMTGVDIFPEMLVHARQRLTKLGDGVVLVESDNTAFLERTGSRFDVVTSAFCIHHLDPSGKRDIFRKIAKVLNPGGVFLLLDLTTFADPTLRKISRRATEQHMLSLVHDEKARAEWLHHWNHINIPDPADDQASWMREAGLAAEIVARWYEVCLIYGTRL